VIRKHKNIIKGNTLIETDVSDNYSENKEIKSFNNDYSNYEENCNISWLEWNNFVWNSAQKIAEDSHGNIINAYHNPNFAKQVKARLLFYLPI